MSSRLVQPRRGLLRIIAVAAGMAAFGAASALPAAAHNVLVGSSPEADEALNEVPDEVVLEFNDEVMEGGNGIVVTGPDGGAYESGAVAIDGVSASIALDPLTEPGDYTVDYRIISADGHPLEDSFGFSLSERAVAAAQTDDTQDDEQQSAEETQEADTTGEAADGQGDAAAGSSPLGMPLWVGVLLAIGLVGVIVALIVVFRRGGPGTPQ